jgi:ribonuclease T2
LNPRHLSSIILAGLLALSAVGAEARHGHHGPALAGQTSTSQAGVFDYYLLSLSWSPTYCLTHRSDKDQCGATKGFGFVLHGLWPQYASGGYPHDCATQERLTPEAIKFGETIFPSPKLIEHEWGKHGTCNGTDALTYFKTADQVRTSVKVPADLDAPAQTQSMTVPAIIADFVEANSGMPANAVVVACSGPELSEVRICFDRKLSPMACGKGVRSSCRKGPIRVRAVR